jgi:nitrite reductase (NO-forming)
MNNKYLVFGLVGALIAVGALFMISRDRDVSQTPQVPDAVPTPAAPVIPSPGVSVTTATTPSSESISGLREKSFAIDSWMEMVDGKMSAHFSVPVIEVKQGDLVRLMINNSKGTHDFVIDEYGIKMDTPEGQLTSFEFVADKVGEFEYYCSKYNHRNIGQKGILRVVP